MRYCFLCLLLITLYACEERIASAAVIAGESTTGPVADTASVEAGQGFVIPVLYKNLKMGKDEHTRLVLQMYHAWDKQSVTEMEAVLADTVELNLPEGETYIAPRGKIIKGFVRERKKYRATDNEIIYALPLRNQDVNEDWVNVLVYNKWTNHNYTRDSMLFQDLWKVKDGKITYLLSLEQTPSRAEAMQLEKMMHPN